MLKNPSRYSDGKKKVRVRGKKTKKETENIINDLLSDSVVGWRRRRKKHSSSSRPSLPFFSRAHFLFLNIFVVVFLSRYYDAYYYYLLLLLHYSVYKAYKRGKGERAEDGRRVPAAKYLFFSTSSSSFGFSSFISLARLCTAQMRIPKCVSIRIYSCVQNWEKSSLFPVITEYI